MPPELIPFCAFAQALERLLHPWAEVVLHDLKKQRIAAIYNNFSRRNVGDDCLIDGEVDLNDLPDYFTPYYKLNWDGRKLKSTSVTIRNPQGEPVGLVCINLDISPLDEWQVAVEQFIHLKPPAAAPQDFFFDNWREKVNSAITQFLTEMQATFDTINAKQKRQLFQLLKSKGLLQSQRTLDYVYDLLQMAKKKGSNSA